jgi:uncharacterized membrane protein YfcA
LPHKGKTLSTNISLIYINAIFFFLIALIYSSAGFGGGSLYLALLSGSGLSTASILISALTCNAIVTAIGTVQFYRSGNFNWEKTKYLLLLSVPFSMIAGSFRFESRTYSIILACCLILAALVMLFGNSQASEKTISKNWVWACTPIIGIMSGLSGIGGGIYLAPLLYLTNWAKPKEIAAISAVFILVNSIGGLAVRGDMLQSAAMDEKNYFLPLAVIIGAYIGSKISSSLLSQIMVKNITMGIMIFAAVRLFFKVW